jgi:hypothetical protein
MTRWAEFYPYALNLAPNTQSNIQVRLTNHSPIPRSFVVSTNSKLPAVVLEQSSQSITLGPEEVGTVTVRLTASGPAGSYPITASVRSDGLNFEDWIEAIVTIEP